jgi:anti-sigma regulatory factor (Ser/Thr protein kinase)
MVDSDEAFVSSVAPFFREGLDEGPTVAVLSRRRWALLRDELGADAERVAYTDCDDFYVRPIDALAAYDAMLRRLTAAGAISVRVAGEIPLGPTRSGWADWGSYEALLNGAFAGRDVHVLCVYDTRTASDAVIDAVWQTHPHVAAGPDETGPVYHPPQEVVAALASPPRRDLPLHDLPLTDDAITFREELSAELASARIPGALILNMLVAAVEVFDNALRHGGGPTALRAGLVEGWFVCEVEDRGPGLADPLAGYLPPAPERAGPVGLWVARRLISRLELIPTDPGLTVRLWL